MDILYLLIPLSAVLMLLILGVFAWALQGGQFDDLRHEGERILQPDVAPVDADQAAATPPTEQSVISSEALQGVNR